MNMQNEHNAPLQSLKIKKIGKLVAKAPNYLIKDFLEMNKNTAIYGPSGVGKSFVALDAGYAIAAASINPNISYHGKHVTQSGPVLYCCGEGQEGIDNRLIGIENKYNLPNKEDVPFYQTEKSVVLNNEINLQQLFLTLDAIKEAEGDYPKLIMFDTLNKSFMGNENSADDMGALVRAMDEIRYKTNACVMIIHHSGNNGEIRGSSALKAGLDKLIAVFEDEEDDNKLIVSEGKSKDSAVADNIILNKEIVKVGWDERYNEDITTLVLHKIYSNDEKAKEKKAIVEKAKPSLAGKVQPQVFDIIAEQAVKNPLISTNEIIQLSVEKIGGKTSAKQVKDILSTLGRKGVIQMTDENIAIVGYKEILEII